MEFFGKIKNDAWMHATRLYIRISNFLSLIKKQLNNSVEIFYKTVEKVFGDSHKRSYQMYFFGFKVRDIFGEKNTEL